MNSLQKKIFTGLFIVFLSLLGFLLPHRPVEIPSYTQTSVLGEIAPNAFLSELNIQPESGNKFLVDKIGKSQSSIHMQMYLLSDPEIVDSLISAHNRGVEVKIILEKAPFGGGNVNKTSKAKLVSAGIEVRDPPALIALNHIKSVVVDHTELIVMTLNLTKAAFSKNREFSVSDRAPPDVSEAEKIFDSDWNRLPYFPTSSNLIVSPENSRNKIVEILKSSKSEILIQDEVVQDPEITSLLINLSDKGISIKLLLSDPKGVAQNLTTAQILQNSKVQTKYLTTPYLHSKLIIVDQRLAYFGSINLTKQSLDQNRELGIMFSNQDLINKLINVFDSDWKSGQDFF